MDWLAYSGKWHEFARTPLIWEEFCDSATANYTLNADQKTVSVVNRCYSYDGKLLDTRMGTATIAGPYHLSLIFDDGRPASIIPARYEVLLTDYKGFAVVQSDKNLWILTREAHPSRSFISGILRLCSENQIDTRELTASRNKL